MQRIETYRREDLLKFIGISLFLLTGVLFSQLLVQISPVLFIYLSGFLALLIIFFFNLRAGIILLVFLYPLLSLVPDSVIIFPESTFSVNLTGLLNLFSPLFLLVYLLTHKGEKISSSLTKPILIFLGILLLTVFTSFDSWISLRNFFRLAMPISVYFLILQSFKTEEQIDQLKKVLLYSSIMPLLLGFYQILSGIPQTSEFYAISQSDNTYIDLNRIISSFAHPNQYAAYLVILIPLVIFFYSENRNAGKKFSYLLLLAGMLISLFCTYARVAWAAFLGSLTILGMIRFKKIYLSLVLILLVLFLLIPSLNQIFMKRIQPDNSFYQRFSFNLFSLYLISQKPILGWGTGCYSLLSASTFGNLESSYGRDISFRAHNDYLMFLSEIGIVGFSAYLFLFYSLFKLGHKIFKNKSTNLQSEGSILLAVLAGVLLYNLSDQGFSNCGFFLWVLIGIVESRYRLSCSKLSDKSHSLKRGVI
jgi:O-antigen ligase